MILYFTGTGNSRYIAMYDAPDESVAIQIIENANPMIGKIGEVIRQDPL